MEQCVRLLAFLAAIAVVAGSVLGMGFVRNASVATDGIPVRVLVPPQLAAMANVSPVPSWLGSNDTLPPVIVSQSFNFSANASCGTSAYTHRWHYGDGSAGSTLANLTRSYDHRWGVYTANVTVADAGGAVATAAITAAFYPEPCPPPAGDALEVVITQSTVGYCYRDIWNEVTFHANVSNGAQPYRYRWDFGDGSPVSTMAGPIHSFAQWGSHTINLTVTDGNGLTANASLTFIVSPPPCASLAEPPLWIVGLVASAAVAAGVVAVVASRRRRPGQYR